MSDFLFLVYQLEWSKSYARSQRWQEEVELLREEMRRTLEYLRWRSSFWVAKAMKSDRPSSSPLCEGLNAYAFQQADVFMSLHDRFLSLWQGLEQLDSLCNRPESATSQSEEVMQGVDGGDGDIE